MTVSNRYTDLPADPNNEIATYLNPEENRKLMQVSQKHRDNPISQALAHIAKISAVKRGEERARKELELTETPTRFEAIILRATDLLPHSVSERARNWVDKRVESHLDFHLNKFTDFQGHERSLRGELSSRVIANPYMFREYRALAV